MIGQTISHYKILEKLGEGGMGVVYKAQDIKLDRVVALKFLPHHISASPEEQERFLQEARAASALNHPNVCGIHSIGEYDDPGGKGSQQFIDMEFVEGNTLKDEIRKGLKFNDAVSYSIQIGEALHAAHGKGIVHRDIKTENVMLASDGRIKVMDFGLAKLKGSLKLTKTSSTVGTLAYMAPEQIQGEDVDGRSDIFSFGVMFFEMLTGKLPFRGEHDAAMMYSIMNEDPEPLQKQIPDASSELLHIINRALEKNPSERYQHVEDMVIDLRRLKKDSSRVSRAPLRESGLSGKPHSQQESKRILPYGIAASALLILGALSYFLLVPGAEERIDSIAVMPLVNESEDPDAEYLSDGIAEGVMNTLSKLPGLRVVPRSSVFFYKGKDVTPQKIADELNVRSILTGKVHKRGENLVIQVELIDVKNQSQMWGEKYTRQMSALVETQDQISQEIALKLEATLSGDQQSALLKTSTQDPEAYRLYLKGRYLWNKRSGPSMTAALENFEDAIKRDPTYALAYAGMADTYITLGDWAFLQPKDAYPKARAAAEAALKINSELGEAHTALAYVTYAYDWNWEDAEKRFVRAIALTPNYPTVYQWCAEFYYVIGRYEESLAMIRKAHELDPLSPIINSVYALVYIFLGEYEKAVEQSQKALELDKDFYMAHLDLYVAYFHLGEEEKAAEEFLVCERIYGTSPSDIALMQKKFKENGWKGLYRQWLKIHLDDSTNELFLSSGHAYLGEKEKAFEMLERAYENRSYGLFLTRIWPEWRELRKDPRWKAAMVKAGLKM